MKEFGLWQSLTVSLKRKRHAENVILELLILLLYGHKLEVKTQRQRPAREVCLLLLLAPALWSLQLSQPATFWGVLRALRERRGPRPGHSGPESTLHNQHVTVIVL